MRFSSILVSLAASIGSALAVNVGQLTVTPSTLKPGDLFVVEYNSTQAVAHPQFVDFYVHDGQTNALYQLMRFTYPAQTNAYFFQKALPVIDSKAPNEGYVAGAKYDITAFVTYPVESGTLTVGRIDAPIQVQV